MSSTKKQTPNTNKNVTRKKRIKKVGESCVEKDEQCQRGTRCVNTKEYGKVCIDKNELEQQKTAQKNNTLKETREATDVQEDPVQAPLLVNDEIEQIAKEEEKEEEKTEEKEEEKTDEKEEDTAYTPTTQQEQLLKDYEGKNQEEKERMHYSQFSEMKQEAKEYDFLYPELNDPELQLKIAQRQEFASTRYDGEVGDVQEKSEEMCNKEFSLMPHQTFVRNFLSLHTPYNALLLFHGLGSGKTCSAIGIAEEARQYQKQISSVKTKTLFSGKICIVASPAVQKNFRLQLFDERKLKQTNGQWNLHTCVGENFLNEINPMNVKNQSYDKVVNTIQSIINDNYIFIGYRELTNKLYKIIHPQNESSDERMVEKKREKRIRKYIDNSLFIIDEFHNIRNTDDKKDKILVDMLFQITKYCDYFRLLLLSATPMYNSPQEVVWFTNLLNAVDKRSKIKVSDVFDKDGNLLDSAPGLFQQPSGEEKGAQLLKRKLNGYISYVRGENPYTFPYRLYPTDFINTDATINVDNQQMNSLEAVVKENYTNIIENKPEFQMNNNPLEIGIQHMDLYTHSMEEYQTTGYNYVMEYMKQNMADNEDYSKFENMESFGYTFLQKPLEALNIVFPVEGLQDMIDNSEYKQETIKQLIGVSGLKRAMSHKVDKETNSVYDYEYKIDIPIFHQDHIRNYSHKIAKITKMIKEGAQGIIMVYSHYLSAGIIPMALALEEMGFARYSSSKQAKSLFSENHPRPKVDSLTMRTMDEFDITGRPFQQARYVMITGEKELSANNIEDLKYITHPNNADGSRVKVVLITRAAAEGLDFKNIRQTHLLEPWYNTNRMEQIIGRSVRNNSHCDLELNQRNVEIYFHSTTPVEQKETVDLYIYRYAEIKATKIGNVTRLLKEVATDCLLNHDQTNFTETKMNTELQILSSTMSSSKSYKIGDKAYSSTCDYMESCDFKCMLQDGYNKETSFQYTNSSDFAKNSILPITKRLRQLFKENIFYHHEALVQLINANNAYNEDHIEFALERFTTNKNDYIMDQYNRKGYLIRKGDYILFQPLEITDEYISLYERTVPIQYKEKHTNVRIPTRLPRNQIHSTTTGIIENNVEELTIMDNAAVLLSAMVSTIENSSEDKKTWYYRADITKGLLMEELEGLIEGEWKQLKVDHYLDLLEWNKKEALFNYMLQSDDHEYKEFVLSYMNAHQLSGYKDMFLFYTDKVALFKIENNQLIAINDALLRNYKTGLEQHIFTRNNLSELYGFLVSKKSGDIEFKLKQSKVVGNYLGRVCNNSTVSDIYNYLNSITKQDNKYNEDYLNKWAETNQKDKAFKKSLFTNATLCTFVELLLRSYNKEKRESKLWLLSLAERNMNNHLFEAPKKKGK
jgi:hypothetical protein